jgi:hypothetical protein
MRKIFQSKWFKIPFNVVLYGFSAYGFILTVTYFAMKFKLTNEAGSIDANNRYFQEMHDKYNQSFKVDSVSMMSHRYEVLNRILLLNQYYPKNAQYILEAYQNSKDEKIALQMLDAVDLRLNGNAEYLLASEDLREKRLKQKEITGLSVFEWMNIEEWKAFRIAVQKDKKWIDSAAHASGVEARLIVACLAGEQIRLFNSKRESYKRYIGPLKVLVLENNLSYGVTGIKENTAIKIEQASIVLCLADASNQSSVDEVKNWQAELEQRYLDKRILLVANKIDLDSEVSQELSISAKNGIGIDLLKQKLVELVVGSFDIQNETIVSNARHYEALMKTSEALEKVRFNLENGTTGDFVALDIRAAMRSLGNITGEIEIDRDILGTIFERFCIGK